MNRAQMQDEESKSNLYECNICLETATEPVITPCGHLFCWPCIYSVWFSFRKFVKIFIIYTIVAQFQSGVSLMSCVQKWAITQISYSFIYKRRWE